MKNKSLNICTCSCHVKGTIMIHAKACCQHSYAKYINTDGTVDYDAYNALFENKEVDCIFTDEFLKELGLNYNVERTRSEYKPHQIYGKATDRTGMTVIYWNENGASCTYFGNVLEPNNVFEVKKDGGTRTAFNGYVFNQDDVRKVLNLTW